MRLVRFTEDDGAGTICGTYTAYNGITGFPSLFISNDLKTIASHTMAGKFVKNKGMALFHAGSMESTSCPGAWTA